MLYRNKEGGRGKDYCEYVSQTQKALSPRWTGKKMTLRQIKRAGRLQEKGSCEYGEDDSWTSIRGINKRPLAFQRVPFCNETDGSISRSALAYPYGLPRGEKVGYQENKIRNIQSIPRNLRMANKNGCVIGYLLASK
mgnify:CR=1 FL=1